MDSKTFEEIQILLDTVRQTSEVIDEIGNVGIELDALNNQLSKKDKELSKELTGELAILAESLQKLLEQNKKLVELADQMIKKQQ